MESMASKGHLHSTVPTPLWTKRRNKVLNLVRAPHLVLFSLFKPVSTYDVSRQVGRQPAAGNHSP